MHPLLAQRRTIVLYLAAWLAAGTGLAVSTAAFSGTAVAAVLASALPLAILFGFVCLSPWYVIRPLAVDAGSLIRTAVTSIAAAVLSTALLLAAGVAWTAVLDRVPEWEGIAGQFRASLVSIGIAAVVLYLFSIVVHVLLHMTDALRREEQRALEARLLAGEAELRAMRAQLDPHFLFNSLNSISALTASDPAAARAMTIRLADFLRGTLRVRDVDLIPLGEELAFADMFLDIERVRFGTRLAVERRIGIGTLGCRIPPLLLQPLLENAVRHGIAQHVDGGTIGIEAARQGDLLRIIISNPRDTDADVARGGGLGHAIVRGRLAAVCGDAASLTLEEDGRTYRAVVMLPCGEDAA